MTIDAVTAVRRFETTCSYCGGRSEVTVPPQSACEAVHSYRCPECGKETQLRASLPPLVRPLSPRTDGKSSAYQETFF